MARCAQHPEAEAVAACVRCGSFLCGACVVLADDAALCAPCARLLGLDRPLPTRVRVALGAGLAGLLGLGFACSLPPVPSLLLGAVALWVLRTERADASVRGVGAAERRQRWVRLGRLFAWANVVLAGLYLATVFVVLVGVWWAGRS